MIKLARTLAIVAVLGGFFALGQSLRPTPASADIYERVEVQMSALVDMLRTDEHPAGKRLIQWNGETLYSELSRSEQTPRQILDELDARAALEFSELDLEETREAFFGGRDISLAFRKPFRNEGPGWGIFGRLTAGPLGGAGEIITPLIEGRGLGETSKGGFVLFATRDPNEGHTDVWTIRFKNGLDPAAFIGKPGEDVRGGDLPGIDRHPGSTRILRMTESSVAGVTHIVAYDGGGTLQGHIDHYGRVLTSAGLSLTNMSQTADEALLQFAGNAGQVDVFINASDEPRGGYVDLIQLRP